MSKGVIRWRGLDELRGVLKKAVKQSPEKVNKVIQNNAENLMKEAKGYAPVDTGFLKENISVEYPNNLRADIKSGAAYASFQEYGTRFQTGTPHMRPAYEDTIPELEQDIKDVAGGMFV